MNAFLLSHPISLFLLSLGNLSFSVDSVGSLSGSATDVDDAGSARYIPPQAFLSDSLTQSRSVIAVYFDFSFGFFFI